VAPDQQGSITDEVSAGLVFRWRIPARRSTVRHARGTLPYRRGPTWTTRCWTSASVTSKWTWPMSMSRRDTRRTYLPGGTPVSVKVPSRPVRVWPAIHCGSVSVDSATAASQRLSSRVSAMPDTVNARTDASPNSTCTGLALLDRRLHSRQRIPASSPTVCNSRQADLPVRSGRAHPRVSAAPEQADTPARSVLRTMVCPRECPARHASTVHGLSGRRIGNQEQHAYQERNPLILRFSKTAILGTAKNSVLDLAEMTTAGHHAIAGRARPQERPCAD
jgi:hypothetical protein